MRTIIPRKCPNRENIKANSEVTPYTLTPEELKKYDNLPIATDSNGKTLRKKVGIM